MLTPFLKTQRAAIEAGKTFPLQSLCLWTVLLRCTEVSYHCVTLLDWWAWVIACQAAPNKTVISSGSSSQAAPKFRNISENISSMGCVRRLIFSSWFRCSSDWQRDHFTDIMQNSKELCKEPCATHPRPVVRSLRLNTQWCNWRVTTAYLDDAPPYGVPSPS